MEIYFSDSFKKNYQKRVGSGSSLEQKYLQKLQLFKIDPRNKILRDHKLTGKMLGFRAFRITGDVRVVYRACSDGPVVFVDIGTHNQVYS